MPLFNANVIPFERINHLNEDAPNLIVWAVPAMLFFTALEMFIAWRQDREFYEKKETIGSIGVGLGNLAIGAGMKVALLYILVWIYNALPWRMELAWWTLVPCYVIFDLCSYWAHRISHERRFFWATHVPHHSGEHYNLAVSFRLSWIQHLKLFFFLPTTLFGFHPVVFFVTNQIAVLFQFWVHTEYIRKLPRWIEYIFATPSNHRVHHGTNPQYIDKNYGATFIFWDRIFGTFEPEVEQAVYGLTTNIDNKANPVHVNFHELIDIWRDVMQAKGFKQKWFYAFGPPIKVAEAKKAPGQTRELTTKASGAGNPSWSLSSKD